MCMLDDSSFCSSQIDCHLLYLDAFLVFRHYQNSFRAADTAYPKHQRDVYVMAKKKLVFTLMMFQLATTS